MSGKEKTIIWCDKIMAFSFYALIYFLPISIALSETFTGIALFCYLLKRWINYLINSKGKDLGWFAISFSRNRIWFFLKSFKPIDNCLNIPITVFLIISFISAVLSQRPSVSWAGFFGKTLQNAFIYFNFIECINSRKRLKIFLNVFFVSCVLICINGFYQGFIGQGFIHGHYFDGRISSSLRHANDLAGYLVIVTPLLLSISLIFTGQYNGTRKHQLGESFPMSFLSRRDTVLSFILFLITLACLGLTYSRGAWVGFVFATLLLGFQRKKFILTNCLIIILFFSIFYPRLQEYRSIRMTTDTLVEMVVSETEKIEVPSGSTDKKISLAMEKKSKVTTSEIADQKMISPVIFSKSDTSFLYGKWLKFLNTFKSFGGSGRGAYWQEALAMIKEYPLFGAGLNAYSLVAPKYKINWGGYPHNCYLQMLGEIGIVGFLSFMWILFRIFRTGIKNYIRMHDLHLRILLLGVMTGYTGFLVHSFFDTNFYSVQLGSLMWVIMGLFMVVPTVELNNENKHYEQKRNMAHRRTGHISKFTIYICAFVLVIFIVVFCYIKRTSINPHYGKVYYKLGAQCASNCSYEKQMGYFKKAIHYDPNLSKAYFEMGIIYKETGNDEEALESFFRAAELDHTDWQAYFQIGYHYFKNNQLDYALRYYKQAYSHAGTSSKLNFYLALTYELHNEHDKAIHYHQLVNNHSYEYFAESMARLGVLSHLVNNDAAARNKVVDLRNQQRHDWADQLERFINTDQYPEFMESMDISHFK